MLQNSRFLGHVAMLAIAAGLWGCEPGDDDKPAAAPIATVKTKPPRRAPTIPTVLATNVKVDLPEKGEPAQWQRLYGSIVARDGKTIVQLTSYPAAEKERFPSLMIHAVESCDPEQLAGRTVKADGYYTAKRDGVVWQSPSEQPIELRITSTDEGHLRGEIVSGVLSNGARRAELAEIRGRFKAELIHSTASPGR